MGINGLYKKLNPFLLKDIKIDEMRNNVCGIDISSWIHALGSVYNSDKQIVQHVIRYNILFKVIT